jgi:hypothetical protein
VAAEPLDGRGELIEALSMKKNGPRSRPVFDFID